MKFIIVLILSAAWGGLIKLMGGTGSDIFIGALGAFVLCSYIAYGNWRH